MGSRVHRKVSKSERIAYEERRRLVAAEPSRADRPLVRPSSQNDWRASVHSEAARWSEHWQARSGDSLGPFGGGRRVHSAAGRQRLMD
jgi:hypothetical protein